jgi:hypothetical protein
VVVSKIVFIDDEPDPIRTLVNSCARGRFEFFDPKTPSELTKGLDAAKSADLLVLDFFWGAQDDQAAALIDDNGLSILRKWFRVVKDSRPPTALVSNHIEKVLLSATPAGKRHIDAKKLGVEWVGEKDDFDSILELANESERIAVATKSMRRVRRANSERNTRHPALEFLCVSVLGAPKKARWKATLERQVDSSRPPQFISLGETACSREIMAWLLHNVLPYPSFLLTDLHAAVRLGIELSSFEKLACSERKSRLSVAIKEALYSGPLDRFLGRRWWRAGIDYLVWTLSQSPEGYSKSVARLGGRGIKMLGLEDPVVLSDADLVETDKVAESSACVRAQDEDFPPNVEPAWVPKTLAANDITLRNKVIFDDQATLVERRR